MVLAYPCDSGEKYAIGIASAASVRGKPSPPQGLDSTEGDRLRETLRPRPQSSRNPAPARAQPGAVLDPDRRDAKRRLSLRERARDAEARARAAAARARRADRPFAGEARRLRDHQLSQGVACRSLSNAATRGEGPQSRGRCAP